MKRMLGYALLMMLTFVVCQSITIPAICAQEGQVLSIDEVIKNTDRARATKEESKAYYEQVKGKQGRGEGIVVNVLPPRTRSADQARVTILTQASKPDKGYNVVLYTSKEAMSGLRTSDRVSFEGKIGTISSYKGVSVDLIGTYRKLGEK